MTQTEMKKILKSEYRDADKEWARAEDYRNEIWNSETILEPEENEAMYEELNYWGGRTDALNYIAEKLFGVYGSEL